MPIILGAFAVFLIVICLRLVLNARPETLTLLLKSVFGAIAIVGIALLILSGRFINAALGLVGLIALLPLVRNFIKNLRGRKDFKHHETLSMTLSQACNILALSPHATIEDINAAHHRLIKQIHPDHGGSDYLAAQVNRARDVLLKHHKNP